MKHRTTCFIFTLFFSVALLCNVATCLANKHDTLYVDDDSKLTDREHATYYRLWQRKKKTYYVSDYYPDHKLYMQGTYTSNDFKTRQGHFEYFNRDGSRISEGQFINDVEEGDWIFYGKQCDDGPITNDYVTLVHGTEQGLHRSIVVETGCLLTIGYSKDAQPDSTWVVYYPNGDTQMVEEFVKGERTGYSSFYHPDPHALVMEGLLYKDQKVGTWYYWWPRRPDTLHIEQYLDSTWTAIFVRRFDSFTHDLLEECKFVNEKREGKSTEYFRGTRKVKCYHFCHNDIYDGPYAEYDSLTGDPIVEGNFRNDIKHGPFTTYRNGHKVTVGNYNEGELDGAMSYYYENGKPEETGSFDLGYKTGLWSEYDEDGQLMQTTEYKDNLQHGKSISYENGKPYLIAIYKEGDLVKETLLKK